MELVFLPEALIVLLAQHLIALVSVMDLLCLIAMAIVITLLTLPLLGFVIVLVFAMPPLEDLRTSQIAMVFVVVIQSEIVPVFVMVMLLRTALVSAMELTTLIAVETAILLAQR